MRMMDRLQVTIIFRGVPLAERDMETRDAITLRDFIDVDMATAVWETALEFHLGGTTLLDSWRPHPEQLLVRKGRLSAVIDFGGLGVGDPACDVMAALDMFSC